MLVHCAVVSAVVTEQLVAVYSTPLGPYVAVATPVGPKFVPVSVTVVPPDVGMLPPPATDEITGAVYDSVAVDRALDCPPTVTIHFSAVPEPGPDVHWIAVWAVVTEHDVAVNPVPLVPYVAVTGLPIGPKLVPVTMTVLPPAVGIVAPATFVITGAT